MGGVTRHEGTDTDFVDRGKGFSKMIWEAFIRNEV